MGYRLGVDLGTTYTAAAVNVDGRVEMLGLGIRAMQVPSVVFIRDDGEIIVGEAAEQQGAADPSRVVREFKRRIGDPVPLVVGGSPFSAQALTARLLAWVVGIAPERQGGPPEHVCVTHPANWGPFKRDLLGQAIEIAGLRGVATSTRTEPESAAIAYASRDRVAEGDRVAVYDLGGGTFDAAVLVREGAGFRFAGPPEGVEHLGGIDFDEAVFRHVLTPLGDDVAALDDTDPATATGLARLRRDCVEAKEVLSFAVDTVVPVVLPGVTRSVRLTRGELDDMLRPAIGETVAATRRVLDSAGVEPGDLAAIVLVGGSSRIPLVSELLSAEFGRPLALDNHPKHDVALGAAIRDTPAAQPAVPTAAAANSPVAADVPARSGIPTAAPAAAASPATPVPAGGTAGSYPAAAAATSAGTAGTHLAAPAAGPTGTTPAGQPEQAAVGSAAIAAGEPDAPAGPSPDWRPPAVVGPMHVEQHGGGPASAATTRRRRLTRTPSVLIVTLLMIVSAGAVIVTSLSGETVHREAVVATGALPPFIPANGDPGVPQVSAPAVVNTAAVTGDTPGLYGGTRSDTCNAEGIRTYLEANPAKAQAWATAMELPPAQVGPFLAALTPVTLRSDTAVTNHGFKDGGATPFQSVLQAGTAVLVDPQGLPRVRCYCGNPLGEPDQQTSAHYTGAAWQGFSGDAVTVIAKAPSQVSEFVVVKPDTNEVLTRPRGTSGEKDRAADREVAENVRKSLNAGGAGGAANGSGQDNSGEQNVDQHQTHEPTDQGGTGLDTGSGPGATTGSAPDTGQAPATGDNPDLNVGTEPGAGTEPNPGADPNAGIDPNTGTDPHTGAEQHTGTDPNADTVTVPDVGPNPDIGTEAGTGSTGGTEPTGAG